MTIECHYSDCKQHGSHDGEEGPFCFEPECKATNQELKLYADCYKVRMKGFIVEDMGYNLDELERDNPYNQWMQPT